MDLATKQSGGTVTVTVEQNRIDSAAAVTFKDAVKAAALDAKDRVLLDLGAVDFVDSSGLGAIIAVMKTLPNGIRLDLASLRPPVEKVFKLTRMDSVFRIYPDLATAQADITK
ncbi:STAS domain-containing protein [Cognatishimia sp. MH4019]|uniref:STAS domain-containing protein n=1 Tax=Cognatishimia sp. MH4019 TaxID=2854030 RepID=UPI001CD20E27|nr:STAS domain-containing protein [Cognatishimia sp. MH4019]